MNLDKYKRILKNKRVWIGPKRKDCTEDYSYYAIN